MDDTPFKLVYVNPPEPGSWSWYRSSNRHRPGFYLECKDKNADISMSLWLAARCGNPDHKWRDDLLIPRYPDLMPGPAPALSEHRLATARLPPVGAAAGAGEDVVDALDLHAGAENLLEDSQLAGAQVGTGPGGGADGAVVLDQQQGPTRLLLDLRHVAFAAAQAGQRFQPLAQRPAVSDLGAVGLDLAPAPGRDQPVDAAFAEGFPHGLDEADGELRMGVRE